MASSQTKTRAAIFILLFILRSLAASSDHFVGNTTQESLPENRGGSSSNWTAGAAGRPVQSNPNPPHHHKSRVKDGSSYWAAVPVGEPSGPIQQSSSPRQSGGISTMSSLIPFLIFMLYEYL